MSWRPMEESNSWDELQVFKTQKNLKQIIKKKKEQQNKNPATLQSCCGDSNHQSPKNTSNQLLVVFYFLGVFNDLFFFCFLHVCLFLFLLKSF